MKQKKDYEKAVTFIKDWVGKEIGRCKKFTGLYVQGFLLKELEPELKYIFSVRLNTQLVCFIKLHISLGLYTKQKAREMPGINTNVSRVTPYDIATKIADDQAKIFLKEIETNEIREKLSKAKSGNPENRRAIKDLVQWDKTAISLDFVVEKMAEASFYGDKESKEFIENVADALKQKVAHRGKIKNIGYVAMFRYWIPYCKARGLTVRQIYKEIDKVHGADFFRSAMKNDDGTDCLLDIDHFVKFVKRNKIIV